MIDAYFCFIQDPAVYAGEGLNHIATPIYYNGKEPKLIKNTTDYPFLGKSTDVIRFAAHFPGRLVKNMKIGVGKDKYLIYSSNASYLHQGWLGLSIINADKKSMPITREIELSNNLYNMVGECAESKVPVNFNRVKELFNDYNNDFSRKIQAIRRNNGEDYNLEQVITPNNEHMAKWDFFICNDVGQPITNILRYQSIGSKFFKMDMNMNINMPNAYSGDLQTLHIQNCMSLASCYSICRQFGDNLDNNNNEFILRHLLAYLPNAKGVGFTLIDKISVEGKDILLVLDIKNKKKSDDKYLEYLYGNERKTLNNIKDEIKNKADNDYEFRSIINYYNEKGNISELSKIEDFAFKIFKKEVTKQELC
jgi:hypothetical protein